MKSKFHNEATFCLFWQSIWIWSEFSNFNSLPLCLKIEFSRVKNSSSFLHSRHSKIFAPDAEKSIKDAKRHSWNSRKSLKAEATWHLEGRVSDQHHCSFHLTSNLLCHHEYSVRHGHDHWGYSSETPSHISWNCHCGDAGKTDFLHLFQNCDVWANKQNRWDDATKNPNNSGEETYCLTELDSTQNVKA